MSTIFSKIVNGEIPCYKIAEDENYFAFLDINPVAEGHTLVITKHENDYIFDLNDQDIAGLMVFAKKIAKAIDKSIDCQRVGVAVMGLDVPHTHIHLIPLDKAGSINFSKPKLKLSEHRMTEIAESIKKAL
jgi:histidine triad (HIT) family protein